MMQKLAATATPSSPATPSLYNTAVHSVLSPQPVMVRVPLPTRGRNAAEEISIQEDGGFLQATKLRYSPVVTSDEKIHLNTTQFTRECEGSAKRNNRASIKSPAPRPLCPLLTEEKHSAVCSTTPTAWSRSTGGLLISPRPSPPGEQSIKEEQRGQGTFFCNVSPLLPMAIRTPSDSNDVESVSLGDSLSAASPRRRVISPSQRHLVYDNDMQQQQNMTIGRDAFGNICSAQQRRGNFSHVNVVSALSRSEGVRLGSSPTAADLRLASATDRMSFTSLRFSLPNDGKSSPFSESSLTARATGHGSQQRSSGGEMVPLSQRRSMYSLVRGSEGWITSEKENKADFQTENPNIVRRCRSVPSGMKALVSSGVAGENQQLRRARTSSLPLAKTASFSGIHQVFSVTFAKATILKEFRELQLKKEELMLMEYEATQRRSIIAAYIDVIRRLLVDFTFGRSIILVRCDGTTSSQSKTDKVDSTSSEKTVVTKKVKKGTVTRVVRQRSQSTLSYTKTPDSTSGKTPQCHDMSIPGKKSPRGVSVLLPKSHCADVQQCQREKEKGNGRAIDKPLDNSFKGGPTRTGSFSHNLKVEKNVDDAHRANSLAEGQLLRLISKELRCRKQIIEGEAEAFHFLFYYHNIIEGALQPSVIILQEACQWQSILIEATNELHRLQDSQIDSELGREIQSARDEVRRLTAVVKKEKYVRFMVINKEEEQERHKLEQFFCVDLAALMDQQVSKTRKCKRQLEIQLGNILSEEVMMRRGVLTEEVRQRSVIYRECEVVVRDDTLRVSNSPTNSHNDKEAVTVNTLIELSAIADADGNSSYRSNIEVPLPTCLEMVTSDVTTLSTVRFVNEVNVPPPILGSTDDSRKNNRKNGNGSYSSFMSMGGNEAVDDECEFFEWNPTSNTMPTTTINTTTGTVNVSVGIQCSIHNPSDGDAEKMQSTSHAGYPLSLSVPLHEPVFPDTEQADTSVKQNADTCLGASNDVLNGDDPAASGPSSSLLSTSFHGASRCDVGVMTSLRLFDAAHDKSKVCAAPINRHIVPCSLNSHSPFRKKIYSAGPSSIRQQKGNRPRMVSCGTQFTPPTKRPYLESVIFDRDPHQSSAQITNAAKAMVSKPFTAVDNLLGRSASSHHQRRVESDGEELLVCANKKEYEDDDNDIVTLDSIQAIESVENWSQTAASEECASYKEDDDMAIFPTSSQNANVAMDAKLAAEGVPEEGPGTRSAEVTQRDINTFPDFSLSTMLEATAAGSFDRGEVEGLWLRKNSCNADEVTTSSSSLSCRHSVSASTGSNASLEDVNKGKPCGSSSSRIPSERRSEPFGDVERCSVGFCYPPLNYMRPTMSWRRQHEELEWRPTRRIFRDSEAGVPTDNVVRSVSRRLWCEDAPTQQVTRFPFEEGPGVWMDVEMPRRPFGFDVAGNKAYEASDDLGRRTPVATTICSPRRRRDASYRFMAEGSLRRSPSHARRSASFQSNTTPTALIEEKAKDLGIADASTLATLCGIVERTSVSPRCVSVEKKSTNNQPRAMTSSYVDAFFKLDQRVAERRRFLAALRHGPVLKDSTRAAMTTTPHRLHCQHHQRHSEIKGGNSPVVNVSFGTSCGCFLRSSHSPQPRPWR